MSKITLESVASGYDLSKINANFVAIAAALNDEVLYRDNPVGETNTLITSVDCNSQNLYNLPEPSLSHQAATKNYVDTAPTSAASEAVASAAAALVSEINAAASEAAAAASALEVIGQKIVWRGAWSGATAYAVNDAVSSSGTSYICIVAHTNQTPPNASYWEVLAAKGSAGAGTGDLLAANNLSDVANVATARTNLGLQIGANVQAYAATASQVEMEAGTEVALRAVSPLLIAQAIAAQNYSGVVLETSKPTTSGTSQEYTIPSGAKRITVMLNAFSTSGTSMPMLRLGDSGGVDSTGYVSIGLGTSSGAMSTADFTDGFPLGGDAHVATRSISGVFTLCLMGSHTWVIEGTARRELAQSASVAGSKALTTEITTLRLTTSGGIDTFVTGEWNITVE